MTILPKKKTPQTRAEVDNATDGSTLQHLSVGTNNHLSHIGPGTGGHSQVAVIMPFQLNSKPIYTQGHFLKLSYST